MKRPILLSAAAASLTAVMLLVGCQDRPTAPPLPGVPLRAIGDAVHGGGNPNFYWLPPMVSPPSPSPTGAFSDDLEPVLTVQICELTQCPTFITELRPVLVLEDELYKVNWHTDESALNPDLEYRIRALVLVGSEVLELGFADVKVGNDRGELRNVNTNEDIPLVDGRTLPIHMRVEEGAVTFAATGTQCVDCVEFVVDETGGTFSHPSGLGATTIDPSVIPGAPPFVLVIDDQTSLGAPGVTPFDEFEFFFAFSTIPAIQFASPGALVGVCQNEADIPEGVNHLDLRLAHELPTDPTGFEILDLVIPPPLICITGGGNGGSANAGSTGRGGTYLANIPGGRLVQRLLPLVTRIWRPRPLHAAALGHGGLGGLVISFSRIYGVDPTSGPAPSEIQAGVGTAVIDGTLSSGEWDDAGQVSFNANLPGGGTTPATLFVMNNETDLYLAVRFQRSFVDPGNTLAFEFDNDNDGVAENGDDLLLVNPASSPAFVDEFRTNISPCTSTSEAACGFKDTDHGGTNDGAGAFANDGTFSVYEMSHPLNTADDDHDFSLAFGDIVGMFLSLRMIGVDGEFPDDFGDTDFPGFRNYLAITIATPVVLYGVNASDDGLSTIDVASGNVTFVGDLDPDMSEFSTPGAMAVRSADNTIFVWNNSGTTTAQVLATVDVCTGLATTVGTTFKGIKGAIAFGSASVLGADSLFGFNSGSGTPDSLIVINPATGAKVAGFPLSLSIQIAAADINAAGVLYGVELTAAGTTERLVTVGTTGVVSVVGNLNPEVGLIGSIVFALDGTLIGSAFGGVGSIIFDIDPSNGNVSNVRSLIGGFVPQGMGFAAACSL